MSLCAPLSRPDMYGLGIRLSFYIQWFAALTFEHIGPESLPEIRLLGLLLSAAVIIGLIAQLLNGGGAALDAAGIYVVLLLGTGSHLFLVPVYVWRVLSRCSPHWNPLAWSQEEQPRMFGVLNFALALTASSVGIWFFATYLPGLNRGCRQFGFFLFSQASLDDNEPFVAANAALYVLMVVGCISLLLAKACHERPRRQRRRHVSKAHIAGLRALLLLSNLTVYAVLVAAVELPVRWNELSGANGVDKTAQLIPVLVTTGIIVRVAFLHCTDGDDDDDDDDDDQGSIRSRPQAPGADDGTTGGDLSPGMEAYGVHMSNLPRRAPAVYSP